MNEVTKERTLKTAKGCGEAPGEVATGPRKLGREPLPEQDKPTAEHFSLSYSIIIMKHDF